MGCRADGAARQPFYFGTNSGVPMRYLFPLACVGIAVVAVFLALRRGEAEPAVKSEDPWVGTYSWSILGGGKSLDAPREPRITITKEGDVYKLSKPFHNYEFKEVKKGVLAGDKGALGYVYLGSIEFSDGRKARVLFAEFCYEHFYLIGDLEGGKLSPGDRSEKKTPPLTVAGAEKLVRDPIFTENPKMNPTAQFPLKDITTKAVWERLDAQIFQVTEGVRAHETYVIKDKKVYHIGSGFGGKGVSSVVVADPNGDGRDKLIFAISFGSGEHRSQVGVFDVLAKKPEQVVAPQTYFGDLGDLVLKNGERQKVEILAGDRTVGRLILEGKEGELKIAIRLNDDLPAEVRKGFKGVE
jgi:hypothetical protein